MNLIKVGDRFVNLDNVTYVHMQGHKVLLFFTTTDKGHVDYEAFDGEEGETLLRWLERNSTDIMSQKSGAGFVKPAGE